VTDGIAKWVVCGINGISAERDGGRPRYWPRVTAGWWEVGHVDEQEEWKGGPAGSEWQTMGEAGMLGWRAVEGRTHGEGLVDDRGSRSIGVADSERVDLRWGVKGGPAGGGQADDW
jgi:hypothetical protein